jgi:hypothetical protein
MHLSKNDGALQLMSTFQYSITKRIDRCNIAKIMVICNLLLHSNAALQNKNAFCNLTITVQYSITKSYGFLQFTITGLFSATLQNYGFLILLTITFQCSCEVQKIIDLCNFQYSTYSFI